MAGNPDNIVIGNEFRYSKECEVQEIFDIINQVIYLGSSSNDKGLLLQSVFDGINKIPDMKDHIKYLYLYKDDLDNTIIHNAIYQKRNVCCPRHYFEVNDPSYLRIILEQFKVHIEDEDLRKNALAIQGFMDFSPLLFAVLKGNMEMIDLLLEYGADINIRTIEGMSVLHYLASITNISFIQKISDFDEYGFYAFNDEKKYETILNKLISYGAKPDLKNISDQTFFDVYKDIREVKLNCDDIIG